LNKIFSILDSVREVKREKYGIQNVVGSVSFIQKSASVLGMAK
jgi:hypothetical protein